MPIYQYTCKKCQRTFDMKRGVLDASAGAFCPICGTAATRKLSTGVNIVIK